MQLLGIAVILVGVFLMNSSIKNRNPFDVVRAAVANPKSLTQILADKQGTWDVDKPADFPTKQSGTIDKTRNGRLKDSELKRLSFSPTHRLSPAAASALESLNDAYKKEFGRSLSVTSTYRNYATQVALKATKGAFAAEPGTSLHGLGLAVDLGGGVNMWNSKQRKWMEANAARFGWISPAWAQRGSKTPEPWHWEYTR